VRIGVDARSLSEPIAGIGRYTLSLLELMVLDKSHEWVLYSHQPILKNQWDMQNVTIRTLSFPKWIRGLYVPWSQFMLPFWARQDDLDIFWAPAHRLPIFLSKSISSVVTIHDLVWKHAPETMHPFGQFLDSFLMPKSVKVADKVIAVSESTAQDLYKEVPEVEKKTEVIYESGSLFIELSEHFVGNEGNYLLFVGTLEPRKNLRRLLEAYSLLSDSIRGKYSLIIVGGKGWGNEDVYSIIEHFNIKKNVKVLGYISDKELADIYRSAHVLVMPSLYEGFGLPLLESMSFGIPIITSNTSSMPEIGGNAAIYVDPNSSNSIKNGIEEVIMSHNLWKKLSKNALIRSSLFSWSKASKETLIVFEKAMMENINNN
jgi:glycosyltransferase involved in cell wall biosynthesis